MSGVFDNLAARPERHTMAEGEGGLQYVPEDESKDAPPVGLELLCVAFNSILTESSHIKRRFEMLSRRIGILPSSYPPQVLLSVPCPALSVVTRFLLTVCRAATFSASSGTVSVPINTEHNLTGEKWLCLHPSNSLVFSSPTFFILPMLPSTARVLVWVSLLSKSV